MPYITKEERASIDLALSQIPHPLSVGQLNYLVTRVLDQHVCANLFGYTSLNNAIGVLECAKLELYRRMAAPYEDMKREQNGDAYPHCTKSLDRLIPRKT